MAILERPVPESERYETDEELDAHLSQIEFGLEHLEAIIPVMRREVATVRSHLRVESRG